MTTALAPARDPARGTTVRSGTVRGSAPLRHWIIFALVVIGRVYRSLLFTLVVIATLPAVGSWTSYVVRTDSMEPSISAGDIVVGRPFRADEKVPVGRVMIFQAPAGSGAGSTLRVHRVVEALGHGRFTTAGDANPSNDAVPVPRSNFRSRAIIEVPYVALPVVWLANGRYLALALWLLATIVLIHLSFRPLDGDSPRRWWRRGPPSATTILRLPRRQPHLGRSVAARTALTMAAAVLAVAVPGAANAAFTDTTSTAPNRWTASSTLRQPYTAAVLADSPYAFHRMDETSGTNAVDSSGNGHTGTYASVASYGQTGALPNNPGSAIGLAANSGRMVAGGTGLTDPTTFSAEMWFKTTTAAGGKLIGFENSRNATSTSFDREVFMRTDGRLVYMGGTSTSKLLVSPTALNNGAWHHVVVTSMPSGSNESSLMYVDGTPVASGTTNRATSSYIGWWRVGFGKVPTGTGYPTTGNFTGSVDDVAVYTTALSSTRVTAHCAAR
jgi:signal peptidase I